MKFFHQPQRTRRHLGVSLMLHSVLLTAGLIAGPWLSAARANEPSHEGHATPVGLPGWTQQLKGQTVVENAIEGRAGNAEKRDRHLGPGWQDNDHAVQAADTERSQTPRQTADLNEQAVIGERAAARSQKRYGIRLQRCLTLNQAVEALKPFDATSRSSRGGVVIHVGLSRGCLRMA